MQSAKSTPRYRKRKPGKKSNSAFDRKLKRLENRLQGEIKKFDSLPAWNGQQLYSTPAVVNITQIPQGDDANTREGLKIKYSYLQLRGILTKQDDVSTVRIIVVKSLKGLVPSETNFVPDVLQPVIYTYTSNWLVLYDKMFSLNAQFPAITINVYRKLKGHCNYHGTAGSATDNGQIFVYAISTNSLAASKPLISLDTRIGFIDN